MTPVRWSRAFVVLGAIGGLSTLVGAGCSGGDDAKPKAGLMIAIRTDMSIPDDIAAMRIEVTAFGVTRLANEYPLGPSPDSTPLPGTLALLPPDNPSAPVKIRVIARRTDNTALLMREAITTVPDDRIALMPLNLQWLCLESVKDTPESKDPLNPIFENSTCTAEQTCRAGKCADIIVPSKDLPDYEASLVFGGGNGPGASGKCFDTLTCFTNGNAVTVDKSDCSIAAPSGSAAANFNVALVLPFGKTGICGKDSCLVPLEKDDVEGWQIANSRVKLPSAVCDKLNQSKALAVAVSTSCETKTFSLPTCGPWSSVTSISGNFDASGPDLGDAGTDSSADASGDDGSSDAINEPFVPPADAKLGLDCKLDAECGTLTCLELDSGALAGSGPAGGLCTRSCAGQAAGFCNFVKPGAECVALNGAGTEYCVEACTPGPQLPPPEGGLSDGGVSFDPNKCNGRNDMACAKLTIGGGPKDVCLPNCNSSPQCPGLFCSAVNGLCTNQAPTGASVGSDCGPGEGGASVTCNGVCSPLVNPFTKQPDGQICSGGCTLGTAVACGWNGSIPANAACFKNGKPSSIDYGDIGQCVELCDCSKSCSHPNQVCTINTDFQKAAALGRPGYCTHPLDELGQPVQQFCGS